MFRFPYFILPVLLDHIVSFLWHVCRSAFRNIICGKPIKLCYPIIQSLICHKYFFIFKHLVRHKHTSFLKCKNWFSDGNSIADSLELRLLYILVSASCTKKLSSYFAKQFLASFLSILLNGFFGEKICKCFYYKILNCWLR